jgi:hypothetical protein
MPFPRLIDTSPWAGQLGCSKRGSFSIMNVLLLLFSLARFSAGIISRDRAGASLAGRDLLDGGLTADSLWLEPGETSSGDSDTLLFSDSDDTSPIVFDQASAAGCGGTQSSLDGFTHSSTLNARDLIDNFPGLRDLVAPLNQLGDDACPAPNSQQSNPGNDEGPKPKPNQEPNQVPPLNENEEFDLDPGTCYGKDYPYALCCEDGPEGPYVYGCWLCERVEIPRRSASSLIMKNDF